MKKIFLAILFTSTMFSCNKAENKSVKQQNLETTITKIEALRSKYNIGNGVYLMDGKNQVSVTKATKLAIADRIGGAISASVFFPWGLVWGAFLATLSV